MFFFIFLTFISFKKTKAHILVFILFLPALRVHELLRGLRTIDNLGGEAAKLGTRKDVPAPAGVADAGADLAVLAGRLLDLASLHVPVDLGLLPLGVLHRAEGGHGLVTLADLEFSVCGHAAVDHLLVCRPDLARARVRVLDPHSAQRDPPPPILACSRFRLGHARLDLPDLAHAPAVPQGAHGETLRGVVPLGPVEAPPDHRAPEPAAEKARLGPDRARDPREAPVDGLGDAGRGRDVEEDAAVPAARHVLHELLVVPLADAQRVDGHAVPLGDRGRHRGEGAAVGPRVDLSVREQKDMPAAAAAAAPKESHGLVEPRSHVGHVPGLDAVHHMILEGLDVAFFHGYVAEVHPRGGGVGHETETVALPEPVGDLAQRGLAMVEGLARHAPAHVQHGHGGKGKPSFFLLDA